MLPSCWEEVNRARCAIVSNSDQGTSHAWTEIVRMLARIERPAVGVCRWTNKTSRPPITRTHESQ